LGSLWQISGRRRGNVIPTKAAVSPVRSPTRKGIRKMKSRGESPRDLKNVGITEKTGDISRILLKIITEAIKKSISHERLFLRAKIILFPCIFAVARKIPVITSKARINSILRIRTKKIIARIGHILMVKPRMPWKTFLCFLLSAKFWEKEIFLAPKRNPAKTAARVNGD